MKAVRDFILLRKVKMGAYYVHLVTFPKAIMDAISIKGGDRVLITATSPTTVTIEKEPA